LNNFLSKISFRYLFQKGSKKLSSLTILTTLGIGVGTAVLIVVLSVMNGFENELQKRILGVIPHITLEKKNGFQDLEDVAEQLKTYPGVVDVAPHLSTQIVINKNDVSKGINLKGTSKDSEISIIPDNMLIGTLDELKEGSNIILGDALAYDLNVGPGDSVKLLNISESNPLLGVPRIVSFKVSGIFSVGSEVDQSYALIDSKVFKSFIKPENGENIELRVENVLTARETGRNLIQSLENQGYIRLSSWDQLYGGLFRAVQLEKIMVSLLMSLILLVAIISLLISINNLIKTNEREIAILRTMGYSRGEIQRIFLQLIFTVGVIGIALGNLLGYLFASNITEFLLFLSKTFNISMLDVYYLDYFPSIVKFNQILMINLITFILLMLFGFIPARKAANTNPINIINHS
tara:strand:+ start:3354 stop:4574 length:1221 start_codon:yes stop_codon:yes gene_type:complete